MKTIIGLLALTIFSGVLLSNQTLEKPTYQNITDSFEIPQNIQVIIDKKCYSCHNSESRGKKAKMKLNFDKFKNGYTKGKIIGKLSKIKKVLEKEKMPPKKYVTNFPDKKLTSDETTTLTNWVNSQINELSK